jgi:hypothetical protein
VGCSLPAKNVLHLLENTVKHDHHEKTDANVDDAHGRITQDE